MEACELPFGKGEIGDVVLYYILGRGIFQEL